MQKEFTVSLQKNDNGRVFLGGFLNESGIQSEAFFTFLYRVTEGLDVTQSVIVHVNIFKKDDFKEVAGTTDDFEKIVKGSWLKCEPMDFDNWFKTKVEFDWNFIENEIFPYDAEFTDGNIVFEKNSKLRKEWNSRKIVISLKEKIACFLSLDSFSADAYQKLKVITIDLSNNENIIKKHAEELKRFVNEAFDYLASLRDSEKQKNCTEISPLIDDVLIFAKEGENFKEVFGKLKDLQDKIKNSMLDDDIRFMFKDKLNDAFTIIKERQKIYFASMEEVRAQNYEKMSQLVDEAFDAANNFDKFKDAWKLLKSTNEKFNGLKMDREKYSILKDKMSEAFETLKKRERVYFNEMEEAWKENYGKISTHVSEVLAKVDDDIDKNEVWTELKGLQQELKGANIKREDQNEFWNQIKGAFETIKEKREVSRVSFNKIAKVNYKTLMKEAEEALNTAYFNRSFNEAFDIIKELQQRVFEEKYLAREKREVIKEKISRAFEVLKNRRERYYAEKDSSNIKSSSEE